ncbi:MAG: HAMP domain-containing sensor histidine kinase [Desulfuromonadales bacterium]|jgi:signal transduction histidine kinase
MNKPDDQQKPAGSAKRQERALADIGAMNRKLAVMNRKLQEAESLKSEFVANIRNEINNPLTAIMGLANQLIGGKADAETNRAVAAMIYAEAFNLDFQLENIIQAAELEAGESFPFWSRTDIGGIIDRILDLLSHTLVQKSISVKKTGPEDVFFVTDARKFHIMMINLLANATEFNVEGGEILIETSLEQGALRITVGDSGIGIGPENHEAVFDRFRQLDSGSTKTHRGHGLGLSIVRSLAHLVGGQVSIDGALGKGCLFTLTLPERDVEAESLASEGNLFIF